MRLVGFALHHRHLNRSEASLIPPPNVIRTLWCVYTTYYYYYTAGKRYNYNRSKSLSSAVETSHTMQTALVWWLSSESICVSVHVPCIVAAATIRRWHLFKEIRYTILVDQDTGHPSHSHLPRMHAHLCDDHVMYRYFKTCIDLHITRSRNAIHFKISIPLQL